MGLSRFKDVQSTNLAVDVVFLWTCFGSFALKLSFMLMFLGLGEGVGVVVMQGFPVSGFKTSALNTSVAKLYHLHQHQVTRLQGRISTEHSAANVFF